MGLWAPLHVNGSLVEMIVCVCLCVCVCVHAAEPRSLTSQTDSLPAEPPGKP